MRNADDITLKKTFVAPRYLTICKPQAQQEFSTARHNYERERVFGGFIICRNCSITFSEGLSSAEIAQSRFRKFYHLPKLLNLVFGNFIICQRYFIIAYPYYKPNHLDKKLITHYNLKIFFHVALNAI